MKESEATELVAVLAASFPRQPIGEPTLKAYAGALADIPVELAGAAVTQLQHSSRFFPSISEIRETVAELSLGAPSPMMAFEQARTAKEPGVGRHPIVQRARRMVGDDWHWKETPSGILQKSFLAAYAEAKAEAMAEIATPILANARGVGAVELGVVGSPAVVLSIGSGSRACPKYERINEPVPAGHVCSECAEPSPV